MTRWVAVVLVWSSVAFAQAAAAVAAKKSGDRDAAFKAARNCLLADPKNATCGEVHRWSYADRVVNLQGQLEAIKAEPDRVLKLRLGEQCVFSFPDAAQCALRLGSAYAATATTEGGRAEMSRAKKMYERFLELAPAGDRQIPQVQEILGELPPDARPDVLSDPNALERAYALFAVGSKVKDSDPAVAALAFQGVLAVLSTDDEMSARAGVMLEALPPQPKVPEFRVKLRMWCLQGEELLATNPAQAARILNDVVEKTAAGDELRKRANVALSKIQNTARRQAKAENGGEEVTMLLGDARVLRFKGLANVLVADSTVIEVRPSGPEQLRIEALAAGRTLLTVILKDGTKAAVVVRVVK